MPKAQILARFTAFNLATRAPLKTSQSAQARAERAVRLVRLGELSRARQAPTSAPLAPGDADTWAQLTNTQTRPQAPYGRLDLTVLSFQPPAPINLPPALIATNLRRCRKGSAPGPTGLTGDLGRVLLDDPATLDAFCQVCLRVARAVVPGSIMPALGLGRLVALRKPKGSVRGLVVGDFLRRLVARSLAQHFCGAIDSACRPCQFALSTRAGSEALAHGLATEADPSLTILSVDGVGAYDHVSRSAMLTALARAPDHQPLLPFPRMCYSAPSTYLWVDSASEVHHISQAEGGEQGDPLMPALFSLALHRALQAFHQTLDRTEGSRSSWTTSTSPPTNHPGCGRSSMSSHARSSSTPASASTKAKPMSGMQAGLSHPTSPLSAAPTLPASPPHRSAQLARPRPPHRPPGLCPGTARRSSAQTARPRQCHSHPPRPDLQCSWLVFLFCACPRAHYALRGLRPDLTAGFATAHDQCIHRCLTTLLDFAGLPASATARAGLTLSSGGLGLRSAVAHAPAAFWASWKDAVPILCDRLPHLHHVLLTQLQHGAASPLPHRRRTPSRAGVLLQPRAPRPHPCTLNQPALRPAMQTARKPFKDGSTRPPPPII